jgi:hypothetical protein
VVEITAEHPKVGDQEYQGVLLKTLLDMAGLREGASKLVLTASDGYAVEVGLSDVLACQECLVAFTDTPGKFDLVMPDLASNFWVKEITQIEVR